MGNAEIIWKDVVGYEGLYLVSNDGQVMSIPRATTSGGLLKRTYANYVKVTLSKGGKVKTFNVHVLMMLAFVGERPEGMDVCHNDGNPYNNVIENLRYDTKSSNCLDKKRHGTDYYASRTHCKHGHEYTEENTRWYKGSRWCNTCTHNNNLRHRKKRKNETKA